MQSSDNGDVETPQTSAPKTHPGKRKRNVVIDTDVESSDTESRPVLKKGEDGKQGKRRRAKKERQTDNDDEDGDKLDPEKEAEIIRAIGTKREGETLGEHQTRGLYLQI